MPICNNCGRDFPSQRSDALYCSGACRVAAHRASKFPSVTHRFVTRTPVTDQVPQVIEGEFREIPRERNELGSRTGEAGLGSECRAVSTSRALVPIVQPGQPFDSRTAAALRQHALAKERDKRSGVRVPGSLFRSFDDMFTLPDEAANEIEAVRLEAERAEIAAEREQLANERVETARAVALRPTDPTPGQVFQATLMALTRLPALNREHPVEEVKPLPPTVSNPAVREPTDAELDQFVAGLSASELEELGLDELDDCDPDDPDPSDFNNHVLADIDAKARQRVDAEAVVQIGDNVREWFVRTRQPASTPVPEPVSKPVPEPTSPSSLRERFSAWWNAPRKPPVWR